MAVKEKDRNQSWTREQRTQNIGTECTLIEVITTEQSLQQLKPGEAPIAQRAPRVTSGAKKAGAAFSALLKLGEKSTGRFKISYGETSARLFWPGLCISSQELVQLLKTLPRTNRIHGASRAGDNIRSFAYGDKLYGSKLAPPDEDGLLLYWKQPPAALAELESDRTESEAATEKVSEKSAQAGLKTDNPSEIAEKLTNLPRFQAAYQALEDDKPPLTVVCRLLELLCQGGGQVTLKTAKEELELGEHRFSNLLSQMDTLLHRPGEYLLFLSLDQKVLLLDLERLNRTFCLDISEDDIKVVCTETIEGKKRAIRLPIELKVKERRALEALLRYGRLSEQELSRITGSRRVGGLLERLVTRLENEGFFGLAVVGEGAEGRIFSFDDG